MVFIWAWASLFMIALFSFSIKPYRGQLQTQRHKTGRNSNFLSTFINQTCDKETIKPNNLKTKRKYN